MRGMVLAVTIASLVATKVVAENALIEYSDEGETYSVIVQDDRVVGGFSQGGSKGLAWGGVKNGNQLSVVWVFKRGGEVYDWQVHKYVLDGETITLVSHTDDEATNYHSDSRKYSITRYDRK